MKQYRISRKIATVPIVAGGFAVSDLARDYDYEALFFRINASIQVTTNCTSVRAEAPAQLIPRIEIIADGKNTLFSAPFWFASLGAVDTPLIESGARALTPPSAATVATYAVEGIALVQFSSPTVRPKDSNFRSSGLSLFQARLTFGNAIDVFVPGAGVAVFSGSPTVDIFAVQMVEIPDATGKVTSPIAMKKVTYQEIATPASNSNLEMRLPAGNLIKQVLIRTDGAVTAGEPSVAVLNNAQLLAGIDVRFNLTGSMIRAKNNAEYGQIQTGYYIADVLAKMSSAQNLTDLWDVSGSAEPKLILDVTGAANAKVQAVTTEYIMAR